MFNRILITGLFLFLLALVYQKAFIDLPLYYYVLSTFLVFPVYLLYTFQTKTLFRVALGLFAVYQLFFLLQAFTTEKMILVMTQGLFLWLMIRYYKQWSERLVRVRRDNEGLLREWEMLQHKHQHRLDNLEHLEKQAASLMDLFEIAKDFNECLSYTALSGLLHKSVKPELPFSKMRLILLNENQKTAAPFRCFSVGDEGVEEGEVVLSDKEYRMTMMAEKEKKMQSDGNIWLFPLFIENECLAHLVVEGSAQGDLAKFEVLVAHLVLQIKKIRLYEAVKSLAIIDDLTQVFMRRHFMELFEGELKRSIKHGFSLALLMLDIDHFKRYNDDFGHLVGDATLREVASILRANLRKVDIVGRQGGEEFIIVIPETESEGALEAAERIRSSIARHTFKVYDVTAKVTASIGFCVYPSDLSESERQKGYHPALSRELIHMADRALYKAKEEGRNQVIRYQDL